jgi:imidazolonepropionase-like amidohydrolase
MGKERAMRMIIKPKKIVRQRLPAAIVLVGLVLCGKIACGQSQTSPMPELPVDVPKDADIRINMTDITPSGQDAVWEDADGTIHEFFQFNDRGRGPKIYTSYRLNADGIVIAEQSKGVDYMKNPVAEDYTLRDGKAEWKNQSENEKSGNAEAKFYIDLNGGPESGAILARALLHKGGKLAVLPSGETRIRRLQTVPVEANGKKVEATLYEIIGLSLTPHYLWLDDERRFFASTNPWGGIVRQGFQESAKKLAEAQQSVQRKRWAKLAAQFTHKPQGDLILTNVNVFDSITGKVTANQRVTVQGDRITSVEGEHGQSVSQNAQVLDGTGKMALPGLWDMHQHLWPISAYLDVAAGITTIRDLANPVEQLTKLRESIANGTQIGPRVIAAGFIDGRGPFQGPVASFADTPEEAVAMVDKYADLGYVQMKIYSSMKPELVPIIAQEAHKRGLRVSGHVPAQMIAEQFVKEGADEIQHINFIMLNFMPDVKETRNPDRFIMPGRRSAKLDLNSDAVNQFVSFLKEHKTVVDPTMAIFEATYTDRPGKIGPMETAMFDRMPVQAQRQIKTAGEALPAGDAETDKLYRDSWANMVRMLKKMYDGGVQIVAGTDQGNGYALHREMEIYQEAGIPATKVLQIATIEAATLMKRDKELGSITPGKIADIILVNGDPASHIQDIRKIEAVIQSGSVLKPAELYPAVGIRAN